MSRIRNRLRFQTPEERVLNALLVIVVAILVVVGISKLREDRAEAAPEVRGISIERSPATTSTRPRATTTSAPTTTTTLDPMVVLWYAIAGQPRPAGTSSTTLPATPVPGFPPDTTSTTRPASTTTTTRPRATTTTSSTTSTTSTTTTTTAPPVVLTP